jgi:hypothetical protein
MKTNRIVLFLALLLSGGCASTRYAADAVTTPAYTEVANPYFANIARQTSKSGKDRLAILAMQGDYRVDFHFQETVPLMAGYEFHDDKTTGGFETVVVVEEAPERIVLQHLLVAPGGAVIKHWRQDWYYEASERFEFVADQTWETVPVADAEGTWTQCVFEVSDAPRYCGTGRWNHRYGVSTWTSDRSWRPLPRREYTKRDDYNAINAENRHTVTPAGWTHEQDNTKVKRDARTTSQTLVREFGFNHYRAIQGYDFSPAQAYWTQTKGYWSLVRQAWDRRLQPGQVLRLDTNVDGMPIIIATFDQASKAGDMPESAQLAAIEKTLEEHTTVAPKRSAVATP